MDRLESCAHCREQLQEIEEVSDVLLDTLALPLEQDRFGDEEQLQGLLASAESLVPADPGTTTLEVLYPESDEALPRLVAHYRLIRLLGRGGMGSVYEALHTRLNRHVAIKLLRPSFTKSSKLVARFHREMVAVGKLDHPNIVRATDAGIEGDTHYLVMELLDGLDLSRLSQLHGPLGIADACEVIRQAACGLEHANEHSLVHRDIKPSNLFLTRDGKVKILDLGLALLGHPVEPEHQLTAVQEVMGTADYMAPEQATDSHRVDTRADIYGLGCTLYELLCGEPPFRSAEPDASFRSRALAHARTPAPSIRRDRPDVPKRLAAIIGRTLSKDSEARHETPAELASALEPFAADADLRTLLESAGSRAVADRSDFPARSRPRRGVPTRRAVIGWVAAIALIAVSGWWLLHDGEPPDSEPALHVSSLEIAHFANSEAGSDHRGNLGADSSATRFDDDVRVSVALSEPAYLYLVAYNPDGREQLLLPDDPSTAPPITERVEFPVETGSGFALNDGVGLQAFAVLASPEPLPPWDEWRARRARSPWKPTPAKGVWRFRGERIEPVFSEQNVPRGDVRALRPPGAFRELCEALSALTDVPVVHAIAFPVLEKR